MVTYRLIRPGSPDSEASVSGDVTGNLGFTMPYDETGGFSTGFAIMNAGRENALGYFFFYDEIGNELFKSTLLFSPYQHYSFMIRDEFPSFGVHRGNVRVMWATGNANAVPPAGFTAIGLRVNPSGTFTSLQVVPQTY
jgi:hypothetical protein